MLKLITSLHDIVRIAIGLPPGGRALIVFDTESELAKQLVEGYRTILPEATFLKFDSENPLNTMASIEAMRSGDLVVLVQSGSFRLSQFRIRLELFKRQLRVIEHPHLNRMVGEEAETYLASLAYPADYYRGTGRALKERIDIAERIIVESVGGRQLVYETPMEKACLNVGDYTGMKNIGGQFPIGEVFTEPQNWEGVNGSVALFAYGDKAFRVRVVSEPIVLHIEQGKIVGTEGAPEEFTEILKEIAETEPLWVRELGFGMNRAFTRHRTVCDIGSYERMCGIHLSLGQKHTIYTKPGMPKRTSKYHVDVFVDVKNVEIDGERIFDGERYIV